MPMAASGDNVSSPEDKFHILLDATTTGVKYNTLEFLSYQFLSLVDRNKI